MLMVYRIFVKSSPRAAGKYDGIVVLNYVYKIGRGASLGWMFFAYFISSDHLATRTPHHHASRITKGSSVCLNPWFSRQPRRSFPAIALPALTGQTLIDVKRIVCPDPEVAKQASPTLVVAYELEDLVFSQQKLRGNHSYLCCFSNEVTNFS